MADLATTVDSVPHSGSLLDKKMKPTSAWVSGTVVAAALLGGLGYIGVHIAQDLNNIRVVSVWPYVLLGVALLIALGFEFVNGFHDTANAVATVIYTHSLDPNIAVVWSGLCNLAGVLVSSGAVAFSVITLLPVELILQVSYGAGFAMVFALLIAAIIWNLSTWWFGLPASSSHTMVGSIIGVGVANQLMNVHSGHFGRGLGPGHQGVPGAAHLAPRRLLRRRSATASLKAVHPHQVGQEFRQPLRCEPQKASLDDFHHRNYGNPWGLPIFVGRSYGFRALCRSGHGRVEADQVFHVLESSNGSHRHDGPGGPSRLVPRSIICQNRHRECRCTFYLAQGQHSSAMANPRTADLHLQRRELCARFQ